MAKGSVNPLHDLVVPRSQQLRSAGPCVGNTPAISSLPGFGGLCLQDSPVGVRYADKVSAFPPYVQVNSQTARECFADLLCTPVRSMLPLREWAILVWLHEKCG